MTEPLFRDGVELHAHYLHTLATAPARTPRHPKWARVVPPPRLSRRALAKAGVRWTPAQRDAALSRPWLTPRKRRALSADLAGQYLRSPRSKPTRAERRALGAGRWPKLARRAAAARKARAS
jgi:CHASE2 domain-containing sensor protein